MSQSNGTEGRGLRRACAYVLRLAGHEIDGLRPGQLAGVMGVSPATVTRDIKALSDEGFVERVPGLEDRWRLGPKVIQVALAHMQGLDRASARLNEVKQRYSRDPT